MTDAAHPQPLVPDYTALPPRRVAVRLDEPTLRAMFGLAADESIHTIQYDPMVGSLTTVLESPRLPPVGITWGGADGLPVFQPTWNVEPRYVELPLADHYEHQPQPQPDPDPVIPGLDGPPAGGPEPETAEEPKP